jgi:hypothetical protein
MRFYKLFQAITLEVLAITLHKLGFKYKAFELTLKSKEITDNLFKEIL